MSLEKRIKTFEELGAFLIQFKNKVQNKSINHLNSLFYNDFLTLIDRQKAHNGWFDKEQILNATNEIGESLAKNNIKKWLQHYSINKSDKKIGVIMAGNIPLVGFHDMLCVLISGNTLIAKLSSNDNSLIKEIANILIYLNPELTDKIKFVDKLENFDAVIATGSDNTARYFEYYFGKYPHIIRKSRTSVAIIHQNETKENLTLLGKDIFQYYGLGCRNVSKLYFPKNYNIDLFFEAIYNDFQHITNNNKYANNYDYNKAVYLMGSNRLLDNGFVLLKEEKKLPSPVGVLHYEFYDNINSLIEELKYLENNIQCVVSSKKLAIPTVNFGETQSPQLSDYADGVDTINFLLGL